MVFCHNKNLPFDIIHRLNHDTHVSLIHNDCNLKIHHLFEAVLKELLCFMCCCSFYLNDQ